MLDDYFLEAVVAQDPWWFQSLALKHT